MNATVVGELIVLVNTLNLLFQQATRDVTNEPLVRSGGLLYSELNEPDVTCDRFCDPAQQWTHGRSLC